MSYTLQAFMVPLPVLQSGNGGRQLITVNLVCFSSLFTKTLLSGPSGATAFTR